MIIAAKGTAAPDIACIKNSTSPPRDSYRVNFIATFTYLGMILYELHSRGIESATPLCFSPVCVLVCTNVKSEVQPDK